MALPETAPPAADRPTPDETPGAVLPAVAADRPLLRRVRSALVFLRSPEGHAALLGFAGSLMMTLGGLGAGATRVHDPLLESAHLSWLRFGHGFVLASIVVWLGVLAMITAWVRLGRAVLAGGVLLNELRAIVAIWAFPLLFAVPMFSQDAYSYLAQGGLLRDGFDPYRYGAIVHPGPLLENVNPVWVTTPCPYGPIFLLLARGVTMIAGNNVVAGTILWRVVMLPGLALMVWAVPHLARHLGGKPAVALWLAVLNPLVLIHLIGGAHNETLMVGLMTAGIALVLERRHVSGIVVIAIGFAIKAMAGLALPFIVWIWMVHERERRAAAGEGPLPHPAMLFAKCTALGAVVFSAVYALSSVVAGVGVGWITALQGSDKIINWLSLPTILAHMTTWVTPLQLGSVLNVTRKICEVAMVAILGWTWWRFRRTEREAVAGIVIALVVIVLLSPAALPWYYSWPLAIGAGFAMSLTRLQVLVGLCTWLMLVFEPDGSIAMYKFWHVLAAIFAAVVAALSLRYVDPLRLRAKPKAATPVVGESDVTAAG